MFVIVSAWKQEINPILENSQILESLKNQCWKVRINNTNLLMTSLGVGYLEAAIQLQSLIHRFPEIDQVLFVGTGGAYAPDYDMISNPLILCKSVVLSDTSAILGTSLLPPLVFLKPLISTFEFSDLIPRVKVATLLSLTLDSMVSEKIQKRLSCQIENMELYGIARVCSKYNIQWDAVLGVTNKVGPNGSKDWKKNHKIRELSIGEFILDLL